METQNDWLTGLFNFRHLQMAGEQLIAEVRSNQGGLGVILADIDYIAWFNHDYTHTVGDQLIKNMVQAMKSCLHENDYIARFGGDEFVVLTPNSIWAETNTLAEKIRVAVHIVSSEMATAPMIPLSVTIGCAMCPGQGTTLEQSQLEQNQLEQNQLQRQETLEPPG